MTTTQTAPVRLRDRQPLGLQEVKDQAKRLRPHLAEYGLELSNNQALELMARAHGFDAWGELKAQLARGPETALPAAIQKTSQPAERISGLTAAECFRRVRHYVDSFHLPSLHVIADIVMTQMLLHDDAHGPRYRDRRTLVDIDKAVLIERLHKTRNSNQVSWRDAGQTDLIAAIRATPFDDLICNKPSFGELSTYIKPALDTPEGGHQSANGIGWHYAHFDLGSYFDQTNGHIAVISKNVKSGGLGDDLARELVDRSFISAEGVSISHDGKWASTELQAAIEGRMQDAGPNGFDDYADKVDYVLSQLHYANMGAIEKPLFLSIPWRPFDFRYLRLLRRAGDFNIRVILRITAADYTESERAYLNQALGCCHTHILGPKAALPQHPDVMPVYNSTATPAYRINPDWER